MPTTRPPKYTYSFKRVLVFPLRLLKPPEAEGAVRVRSCSVVPPLKIQLQDVIDGKHLPPLSSMDFEDFLRYQEHSVENLYFIRWLNEYTATYNAHMASPDAHSYNQSLAFSFTRAKSTFLNPKSPLAVNIEGKHRVVITADSAAYPTPSVFDGARHEVDALLRESLTRFIQTRAQGNANIIHLMCVCTFGLLCTLTGLVPILLQVYRGESAGVRSIRLASIPCFWVGLVAFLGALHGVCPIVWMFGEGRQLRGYELARPPISLPVSHTTLMPQQVSTPQQSNEWSQDHLSKMELGYPDSAYATTPSRTRSATIATAVTLDFRTVSPSPSTLSNSDTKQPPSSARPFFSGSQNDLPVATSPTSLEIASVPMDAATSSISPFIKYEQGLLSSTSPSTMHDEHHFELPNLSKGPRPPPRPRCSRTIGGSLPTRWVLTVLGLRDEDELAKDAGVVYPRPGPFAPMAPIESEIIKRSNYEVIAKSLVIASIITAALSGGLYAVPMKH